MNVSAATATTWGRQRQVLSDYFDLTKPKVQSLLLFTTVTTMEIAGNPPLSKIALTCLGGYLSAGGAGAVNHYWDRDIDARMRRTANRPIPAGRVSPGAALRFGIALALASLILMTLTINLLSALLAFAGFVGYVGVYTIWLKRRTPAQHRDRRRRRRDAAAGRLGRDDRVAVVDRGLPVRDRVLLDAAALLGAQPADEGRVREGRRPDAPGRARRARDPAPDRALRPAAVRREPAAVLRRRVRRVLPAGSIALGLAFVALTVLLYRRADRRAALRVYLYSMIYLALLFATMVIDVKL